jgi:hypothetical protein
LPAIHLAHCYLSLCQESPEQHGGGFRAGQNRLRLDPALELLWQFLMVSLSNHDRVRRADRLPLALWEAREGEELVARFL